MRHLALRRAHARSRGAKYTINGALECAGKNPGQVQSHVAAYLKFTGLLGVSPGSNTGC